MWILGIQDHLQWSVNAIYLLKQPLKIDPVFLFWQNQQNIVSSAITLEKSDFHFFWFIAVFVCVFEILIPQC